MRFGAEPHYVLHTCAVVPATVTNDDFARSGEMCHVPLYVHLGLFAIVWRRQGDDSEYARTHTLCNCADGTSFTSSVAALEYHHDAEAFVFDPVLQLAELSLEPV